MVQYVVLLLCTVLGTGTMYPSAFGTVKVLNPAKFVVSVIYTFLVVHSKTTHSNIVLTPKFWCKQHTRAMTVTCNATALMSPPHEGPSMPV